MAFVSILSWAPAETKFVTPGLAALGQPRDRATPDELGIIVQYESLMDRVRTGEAEALLKQSLETMPNSIPLRQLHLNLVMEKERATNDGKLRGFLDLLRLIPPEEAQAVRLLGTDTADLAWREGGKFLGTADAKNALSFYLLAHLLNSGEVNCQQYLSTIERVLFTGEKCPPELEPAFARAVLSTSKTMNDFRASLDGFDALQKLLHLHYGDAVKKHFEGSGVRDWTVEGEMYYTQLTSLLESTLRLVGLPNPAELSDLKPLFSKLSALIDPDILSVERIGKPTRHRIVGSKDQFVNRVSGRTTDQEMLESLLVFCTVDELHNPVLQLYLLEEALKYRSKDPQVQRAHASIVETLFDGVNKLVNVRDVESAAEYTNSLGLYLQVAFYLRVYTPNVVVDGERVDFISKAEVIMINDMLTGELYLSYLNALRSASINQLEELADRVEYGVFQDTSPKWRKLFTGLISDIRSRSGSSSQRSSSSSRGR
jgi:hypothetical protein